MVVPKKMQRKPYNEDINEKWNRAMINEKRKEFIKRAQKNIEKE